MTYGLETDTIETKWETLENDAELYRLQSRRSTNEQINLEVTTMISLKKKQENDQNLDISMQGKKNLKL